jgi:hypothetical protein
MSSPLIPIEVKAVLPTGSSGAMLFLGNEEKAFVIHIEAGSGNAISRAVRGMRSQRPMTHDLLQAMLSAAGCVVDRVIIVDVDDGVYFARILLHMDNELGQKKVMEIDSRPSDAIALATLVKAPLYVHQAVWLLETDRSEMLSKIDLESKNFGSSDPLGFQDIDEDENDIPF